MDHSPDQITAIDEFLAHFERAADNGVKQFDQRHSWNKTEWARSMRQHYIKMRQCIRWLRGENKERVPNDAKTDSVGGS